MVCKKCKHLLYYKCTVPCVRRRFAIPRKSASFPIFFSFNCQNFCISIPQLRLPENTCVLHRVLDGVHSNCQHTCTRAVMRMEQKTFSAYFVTIFWVCGKKNNRTLKQFLVDVIMQLPKPKYQRKKLETCKPEVVEHTVISQKKFRG